RKSSKIGSLKKESFQPETNTPEVKEEGSLGLVEGAVNQGIQVADTLSQATLEAFAQRSLENMPTVVGSMAEITDLLFGQLNDHMTEALKEDPQGLPEQMSLPEKTENNEQSID
ncbi:hypothetical protein, partial [Okeania sp. SIO1H2]|uniref:hypothetical protein n=1 Tax=Okeania sp. SIO1H2 TaxID=2607775 RepID=UPI00141C7BB5